MRKSHFHDEVLVLLGPIISRLFTCSNEEKNNIKKTKGACSSPISMVILTLAPWATQKQTGLFLFGFKMSKEPRQVKLYVPVGNCLA
jgi:hypothetical protein